jgi:hypothetical protein
MIADEFQPPGRIAANGGGLVKLLLENFAGSHGDKRK